MFDGLTKFILSFCMSVTDNLMEISSAKSQCMASTQRLGKRLATAFAEFGIQHQKRVTSLGGALGAGTRRNVQVLRKR